MHSQVTLHDICGVVNSDIILYFTAMFSQHLDLFKGSSVLMLLVWGNSLITSLLKQAGEGIRASQRIIVIIQGIL